MEDAPEAYKQAGRLMIIAGVYDLVRGLSLGFAAVIVTLSNYGLTCCCLIPPIFPLVSGVLALMTGLKVQRGERVPHAQTVAIVGIACGVLGMDVAVVVVEALALRQLSRPDVEAYYLEGGEPLQF